MHQPLAQGQELVSTVTGKGQVTIPAAVRKRLGVSASDKVAFVIQGDRVSLRPVKSRLDDVFGAVPGIPGTSPDFEADPHEARAEQAA